MPYTPIKDPKLLSKLHVTTDLYDTMSPKKIGEKCASGLQGDHGNLCAKIHNRTQALAFGALISPVLKKHDIIASNSQNPTFALNRAKIVARQLAQATETRPAAFGSHYPEAHVLSNAVFKVTSRAHDFASQQSEKSQSDGPYPPRKDPVAFKHFIKSRFEADTGTKCQEPIAQAFPFSAPTDPAPKKRKTPANPYPKSTRSQRPSNENPYARRPKETQSTSSSGPKPSKSPRQERAQSRDERESEERKRREQAQREKEAEERRRTQQREENNRERTGRQAEQAARNQEEETSRKRKKDEEKDQQARSREPRLGLAYPRWREDYVTQKGHFDDRTLNPVNPPDHQEPEPITRVPFIVPRLTPIERELKEAKRAHDIATATAAAATALAEAKTPAERTDAQKLIDSVRADARRNPALPFKALSSCDQFTYEAFDAIHPADTACNFLKVPRQVPESVASQLATIIGRIGADLAAAKDNNDPVASNRYRKIILAAPLIFLRHSPSSMLTSQCHFQVRFAQFAEGRFGELVQDFNRDLEMAEEKARTGFASNTDNTDAINALRLIAQGEYSKAIQQLDSKGVHNAADPEVLRQLKEKLGKPRQNNVPGTVDDGGRPFGAIQINLRKTFRALKPNKGTGPDNVANEIYTHLANHRPACNEANAAVEAFSILAHEYANGIGPDWLYYVDAHTETVALAKNVTKIDVRPISMSSTFTRAVKKAVASPTYENSDRNFSECQMGAGTKFGGAAQAIGADLALTHLPDIGGFISLDIANAYSETDPARALEKVKKHPDDAIRNLYPLLLATYSPHRTPKGIDMCIETGIAQGCPLSSILFAVAIHDSLLRLREATKNSAVAYQDDTILPTADLAETLPHLVQYSENLFTDVGIRLNPDKCTIVTKDPNYARYILSELSDSNPFYKSFQISCTPEADASTVQWGGGIGVTVNGAPIGDDVFKHYHMDKLTNKTIALTNKVVAKLADKSIQATMLVLRNCIYPMMSHAMSIVRPAIIEHYLNRIDEHTMTVYKELTQIDKVTDYISEDEAFVVEARLWLPIKAGGVGLTPLASLARAAFCGANISALSLLVERKIDGVVYKAAIPELQEFIGDHMGDKDTHLRLAQYSTEATMSRFTRANALFVAYAQLQHQEATGIYNTNSPPDQIPTSGFLSSPFEGLGRDDSHPKAKITTRLQAKLHAPIVSDYLAATESFVDQQLDRSSKVREAFVYTKSYPSTKCFLHANPSRTEAISNTDMQTAICSYLGLPLPVCVLHRNIPLPSGNDQLRLDIHGNNLAKATRITGPSNKTRHDNLLQLIADLSKEAGVEYTIEDTATFAPARDPRSDSHLPPIIPDYKISTSSIQKLFDVKVLGHGTSGFRNGAEVGAVEARADRVTVEYKQKAWAHDQTINSNITSEILESLGGATGLVCGPRGETSKSLDELTLFLAKNAAVIKWNLMGAESIQEAKSKIKNKMKRRIGTMIAKEQAKWTRTRIYQAIVDTGGGPRFGERARRQTAQSQREQAEYADAYAGFARGPRERYGGERRRDDDNVYGGARGNRAGNPDRHRQQGEAETGNENKTESETGNRNENGSGNSNANGSGGGGR